MQTDIFHIPIYEFNIYLFFKKRGRKLLERGTVLHIWDRKDFIVKQVNFAAMIYIAERS